MKAKKRTGLSKHILGLSVATALAACGGGGDSGPSQPSAGGGGTPTTPAPAVTGKAIDGYLVGATVWLDLNNNGVCDSGEPTAVTNGTAIEQEHDLAAQQSHARAIAPAIAEQRAMAGQINRRSLSATAAF